MLEQVIQRRPVGLRHRPVPAQLVVGHVSHGGRSLGQLLRPSRRGMSRQHSYSFTCLFWWHFLDRLLAF